MREGYENVADYMRKSKMEMNGRWGTEFEILEISHLLGCDIYVDTPKRMIKTSARFADPEFISLNGSVVLVNGDNIYFRLSCI